MSSTVERLAHWVAEVTANDVPDEVIDLCRAQRRSVIGAMSASTIDGATQRVLAGIASWAGPGPVSLPGLPEPVRVDDAIYAATVLSIALDFDDYACFAHTGHSAVLVPMLLAAETGSSGTDQLVAQVVANEIEARLGGACLLGPLNGQLWSFVHAAGSAVAAARVLGLDGLRTAHALALALYQAPRPTMPGFMAPDSKLLTAAEPAAVGLRAARLAAAGVTGPLDALDHPQGFFDAFTHAPLPAVLDGLGDGWATKTMSIKPYPGCAYVDTTIDALAELGPPPAEEIARIDIDASVLTCEMDALSSRYGTGRIPTPVTVTFSIPWTVAVMVVAGRLTPYETNEAWLAEHHRQLAHVADRVTLTHDWSLTLQTAEAMAPLLPPRALLKGAPKARRLAGAVRSVRREHEGLQTSPRDAVELVRALRDAGLGGARRAAGGRRMWAPRAVDGFAMTFPARVRVTLLDGTVAEAERAVPIGGAGNGTASPEVVSREKLDRWGPLAWGDDDTAALAAAIDADAPDLWRHLAGVET